jgi:hypothetical protein
MLMALIEGRISQFVRSQFKRPLKDQELQKEIRVIMPALLINQQHTQMA